MWRSGDLQLIKLYLTFFLTPLPSLTKRSSASCAVPLVGHDVVMDAFLHVEQELGIGGLRPEVFDDVLDFRKSAAKGALFAGTRIIEHRLVAE